MARFAVSVFIAFSLCCFVEAAFPWQAQEAISIASKELRFDAIVLINKAVGAVSPSLKTPQGIACINIQRGQAYGEVNRALAIAEANLRRETVRRPWSEFTGLTAEQLRQDVRAKLQPAVEDAVKSALKKIDICRQ